MPTVEISTSADLGLSAIRFIEDASNVLASAAGVPREHVHIILRCSQLMTWGSRLGGVDGAPHAAYVRLLVSQQLDAAAKNEIVRGVCSLLEPFCPRASTQFYFEKAPIENLAIDGLLLPDLIARDAAARSLQEKEREENYAGSALSSLNSLRASMMYFTRPSTILCNRRWRL